MRRLEKQALSKRSLPHNRILCGVGWAHLHQGLDRSDNKLSIHSIVIYLLYIAVYSVHPFPFAPFAQFLWTVIPYLVAWSERNRLQAAGSWTVVTDGHELSGEHKFIINPLLIDSGTSGKISTFRLVCIQPFQAQLAKIISNSSLRFSYVFRDQRFVGLNYKRTYFTCFRASGIRKASSSILFFMLPLRRFSTYCFCFFRLAFYRSCISV